MTAADAPRFGELDKDGHTADGTCRLWYIAAYLPEGREAEVAQFLAEHGIEVYRMWPVSGDPGRSP